MQRLRKSLRISRLSCLRQFNGESMTTFKTKRLIQMSKEQEEKLANQRAESIQRYTNELAQVQGRRCELFAALLQAEITKNGAASIDAMGLACIHKLATDAMTLDTRQKWEGLRDLFNEMGFEGPQPHLAWAAKKSGVELFPAETEDKPLIQPPTVDDLVKVVQ